MSTSDDNARNAAGLVGGLLFGALLSRGGLDRRAIIDQIEGRDHRVLLTMGTAVAIAALGHRWLRSRGVVTSKPKPVKPVALLAGASLFGAGMAMSGYCPGTATAATGSGRSDARWALAGMLGGAAAFVSLFPSLQPLLDAGRSGRLTLRDAFSAPRERPLAVSTRPRPTRPEARLDSEASAAARTPG